MYTDVYRKRFSEILSRQIKVKFLRMPSAAFIAKEYNLYAYNTGPVSRETVRKWINGVNVPTLDKLIFLRQWLNLDMNELFSDIV